LFMMASAADVGSPPGWTELPAVPPVRSLLLSRAETLNADLYSAFESMLDHPETRRSHHFHGRYENLYPPRNLIPAIEPLLSTVKTLATRILAADEDLRLGFWFNRMAPGDLTTLHCHDEDDELLSAVYYVRVPRCSGDILFRPVECVQRFSPVAGQLLFFPPDLLHEVEPHRGEGIRLSVAFNIGPADPAGKLSGPELPLQVVPLRRD
jgi:hypothetical protein